MARPRLARLVGTDLHPLLGFVCALVFWFPARGQDPAPALGTLRVATFNASLNRNRAGELIADLSTPDNPQARNIAEIIQRARPDIILINEFDYDPEGRAAALFQHNYLAIPQHDVPGIVYDFRFSAPVNTGVHSGHDLDRDGHITTTPGSRGYGNDAFGFGQFPGQFGMVLYTRFPIQSEQVRTFQSLLWKSMPGALLPVAADGQPWYSDAALEVLRISSKSHWDVPIQVGTHTIHILASHPTPPVFDGPEDRNGKRNHDEIRIWSDHISGGERAAYLSADHQPPTSFVILGDMNADPNDGDSYPGAIDQLLIHPRVNASFIPSSEGGWEAARLQGGVNAKHRGDPAHDTADFNDREPGNLRVDYVLPSRDLTIIGGAVFWPTTQDPLARLVQGEPNPASSDHRLVYLDIKLPTADDPVPE